MTAQQIQTVFKNLGKLINLANTGEEFGTSLKMNLMAMNDQLTDATLGTYDLYRLVVLPTQTAMNRIVSSADAVPIRAKQAIENYLIVLASALGVSPTDSAAAKLNALKTQMNGAGQTVDSTTSNGFFDFFNQNWAVALPSSTTPTCLDSWITSILV